MLFLKISDIQSKSESKIYISMYVFLKKGQSKKNEKLAISKVNKA